MPKGKIMTSQHDDKDPRAEESDELPFVAPCRILKTSAPFTWLKLGWADIRLAPKQSITYGLAMFLMSWIISGVSYLFGNFYSVLVLASGFMFIGPVIAIGLYSISCQIQLGLKPRLGYCLREGKFHLSNELIFAAILMVVFLIWARAAAMVHVFFPMESEPAIADLGVFLGIGSAVGAIFAAIIFSASAFSLPMIMDRKADPITAVVTSINAVLRNKKAMLVWALIIFCSLLICFATAFIGIIVLLPLIGHGAWHGYQQTIDASDWPKHEK